VQLEQLAQAAAAGQLVPQAQLVQQALQAL